MTKRSGGADHMAIFSSRFINLHIVLGDDPRQHDDERNFHDFGRLKSDTTEAEPTFCPLEIVSIAVIEDQDQEQKQDAGPICDRGNFPKLFGIEMHHDGGGDDADTIPDDLHDGRTDVTIRLQDGR
mgnify:CR=1 FL=1